MHTWSESGSGPTGDESFAIMRTVKVIENDRESIPFILIGRGSGLEVYCMSTEREINRIPGIAADVDEEWVMF
jgi:hypothetical protein